MFYVILCVFSPFKSLFLVDFPLPCLRTPDGLFGMTMTRQSLQVDRPNHLQSHGVPAFLGNSMKALFGYGW